MTRMGHLQMADFASEWWPPSNRCGGRLRVGISGRLRRNTQLPDVDLVALTQRLNDTPRKCLGFRTPAEVLREQITASVGS